MVSKAEERATRIAALPFENAGAPSSSSAVGGFIHAIREAWKQRELLDLLIRRELKARYKDSSLGFVWSLVRPLVMLAIYYFAVGKILGADRGIPQFAIFVFAGLTIWGLYSEIVTSGTMSILSNAGLIKKVYLPREIFPLAATGSALFNFAVQLIVLLLATVLVWQFPWHLGLLYAPVSILLVVLFGTALSLMLSALNVYLRDIQYLVEVGLLILFWASPIVYSYSFVHQALVEAHMPGWVEELYLANPLTIAILAFQKAFWLAGSTATPPASYPPNMELRLAIMLVVSAALIWVGQRVFSRLQGNFAQEI
jgi:ABC-2 type transport system permease protein